MTINKSTSMKHISVNFAVLLGVFIWGLIINAVFQGEKYYRALYPQAQLAVFIQKNTAVSKEVIYEKIVNIERVSEVRYVSENEVFETAVNAAPEIKELMFYGQNPFSAYYLVMPETVSISLANDLKEKILGITGIDDVRFDKNTFAISENLKKFTDYYNLTVKIAGFFGILLVIVRFSYRKIKGNINYRYYLNLLLGAIGSSLAGAIIYYLFSYYIMSSSIVMLPAKYIVYFILGGIWIRFVWEN